MYRILSNLITKHYYPDKETAQEKCDVCFAMGKITEEQYTDLTALVDEIYAEGE